MDRNDDLLELYQAFHMGLVIAALLRGEEFDVQQHLRPALEMLRQVAQKEATIHDPQAEASRTPGLAPIVAQIGSQVLHLHRELAERILQGKESQFQVRTAEPRP